MNQLILGDNLEIMQKMESESIDLIYLDPPFFSNRNYEVIWGDKGEIRSFEDRWSGGIDHYIAWLKERVAEMHRLLKPTGSIYLHCDWHADAYIRVMILDKLFGENNFRNQITWQRTNAHNDARKKMPNLCDTIYYYAKSNKHEYKAQFAELSDKYKDDFYKYHDEKGRYRLGDLTGPKSNPQDPEWKNYHPSKSGRSWSVPNNIIESIVGKEECKKISTIEKLKILDDNGYLVYSRNGIPSVKRYIENSNGVVIGDNWIDIKPVQSQADERIGYPTQKPLKLLERIILASSNEGDVVFDPFVGGGTTIVVAEKLNRHWIGIDQSVQAVKVSEMRIEKYLYGKDNTDNLFNNPYSVQLHKYDYDTLRYKNAFEFEKWIVEQFKGISNIKQRSDFGMDGKMRNGTPIQVKRSDGIGRNVIDNLKSACERYDKNLYEKNKSSGEPVGYIIAFSFGKGAIQEVARLKNEENVIIKLVTVEEIVPIAKKPKLTVTLREIIHPMLQHGVGDTPPRVGELKDSTVNPMVNHGVDEKPPRKFDREIEFSATGESPAGIEFYAFDFDYNPETKIFAAEVMLNKEGLASWKFKPGQHTIAVKAVDNEGLEAIEVLKIKINGAVVRE